MFLQVGASKPVVSVASGESAFLGLVSGSDYLCVDAVLSDKPLHLAVRPGERTPLIGQALGHTLLAADAGLAQSVRAQDPERWQQHAKEIDDAQRKGFALDLDSEKAGISCVAVAVTSRAAIAIAGPTSRLPKARLIEIAQHIRAELDKVRPAGQGWL